MIEQQQMNEDAVNLKAVTKRYGSEIAVRQLDLSIPTGQFVALLGPSGCGKTTTLRMIAGLEEPSDGEIRIKGRRVNDIAVHRRNIGMVFQNHALFPHKSVFQNVAYGLRTRGCAEAEISRRVREALEMVRLPTMEARFPHELSGGQQQRVAIARSIVIEPDLLLLDEPFSALDASLREEMRGEIKRIQRTLGITTLFVTHDQSEALSLSDRIVLMNAGGVEQEGAPMDLFQNPKTEFAARFFGQVTEIPANIIDQTAEGAKVQLGNGATFALPGVQRPNGPIRLLMRAERGTVVPRSDKTASAAFAGVVESRDYLGMSVRYTVETSLGKIEVIQAIQGPILEEGADVAIMVPEENWIIL